MRTRQDAKSTTAGGVARQDANPITAGGVARQDANSKTGRRSGHARQRHRKGEVQAIFKDIINIIIIFK